MNLYCVSAKEMNSESMKRLVCKSLLASSKRREYASLIESPDSKTKFNALRKFYELANQEIVDAGRAEWGIDPYEVDWLPVFTPIEYGLWSDIRNCNAILYPQYPVGRYFVDFANPVAKVAIECDGAIWHTNKEKDRARQDDIESLGWSVYRISGRDCFGDFNEETMKHGESRKFIDNIVDCHHISRAYRHTYPSICV